MSGKRGSRIGIDPFVEADEIKTVKGETMTQAKTQTKTRAKQTSELTLEGVVDISRVAELKQGLSELLKSDQPIKIDASAVEKADGAALQLMLAFVLELRQQKRELAWSGVSDAFRDGARLLGISAQLQLGT